MKRCTKCFAEKETTEFYRHAKAKDKLDWWCKACIKQYQIERRELRKRANRLGGYIYDGKTKACPTCGIEKSVSAYGMCASNKDGFSRLCKECSRIKWAEWKAGNQERVRAKGREKSAKQRRESPERCREYQRASYARRRSVDPEQFRVRGRKAMAKKRSTPNGKLENSVRSAIGRVLKSRKGGRRWESLVGYTIDALRKHLETHFLSGMTWENYGEWHVDHIVPVSAFNFECPEDLDFIRCWALSNLQPLWASDNLRKNNKLKMQFQPSLAIAP